ncbi:1827_t:CDS:2 [Funneliformis mosseae]|uniref:1827_t:CDS:1 n=1 Tax=Funneliformis mosseae TaxID=27381 RepID=A0A9N9G3N5_FUNMO|nr:1827_t:CDS:2 [Funneliformis mosseae]
MESWKAAEDKIQEIFNDINIRAKIRFQLLKMGEADRLNYFVGGNEEIKVTLEEFLKKVPDIVSLQRGIVELNQKMDSGFRKIHKVMEASFYSSGTFNETDTGKLVLAAPPISFPFDLTTSTKARSPGKFNRPPNKDKYANPSEAKIQDYFMSECKALENYDFINNKLTVIDTHLAPTLGTRKPDFLFIPNDSHLDMLNAVVVGEVKKRFGENFSDAQIGQAISFGEKTLQLQPQRNYVYVVLTDCLIINIYKVTRVDMNNNYQNPITQFKYDHVAPQPLEKNPVSDKGWKYLVTILERSPEELGWIEPTLKFDNEIINLVRSVGIGRTSVVYEGKLNNNVRVAVKMAKKVDYLPCFEREQNVLEELSTIESPHIPKILFSNDNTLIMTPFGEKIRNFQKQDIRDIIITLQNVHSHGIIHRDLRKFNFLRNLDDLSIFIADWGYSAEILVNITFAGALECMPDAILESLINGEEIIYSPQVDLICFVRSFYLMLHRPSLERIPFDRDDNIKNRAQMLLNFWKDCAKSEVWNRIYLAIDGLNYEKLIQEIEMLF